MKRIGTREMQIARINVPDPPDLLERMTTQRVRDLATSLETTNGPLHTPVVRLSDRRLVAGWDRIAACKLMKRERVEVLLVDGTDDEMAELADAENLHRRADDQDALKRRMVERRAAGLSKRPVTKTPTRGRPKSAEGVAREEVAPVLRTTPAALKQAAYRDRKKARKVASPADGTGARHTGTAGGDQADAHPAEAPSLPPSPSIETFGLPLRPELADLVAAAQGHLDKAAGLVTQAVAALGRLEDLPGYDSTKAQDLREIVRRAGAVVRAARPASLCPWCKGQDGLDCMACRGQRFTSKGQMDGVPAELLSTDELMVSVNGSIMPLAGFEAQQRVAARRGETPDNRGRNGHGEASRAR